jgi:hypothetical protein
MEVKLIPVDGTQVEPIETETETIEPIETVAQIEPKKRGRPPGAKNKAKVQKTEPEPTEPESEPEPEPEPEPILPIQKRKKKPIVESESESEEELPKPIRRKKVVTPPTPPDSPRTTQHKLQSHTAKLRQEFHTQRIQGYTNLLSNMLH